MAAGKPEYFGCETMCISGTQTEDDTYGADLFFYTSFFKCGDFNCLLQICTSDGISGKYGKNAADCGGRLCNRSEYGNSGVQYRQVQRGDQGWNHAWDFYATSVLAGLVNVQIKHAVDRALPLVNKLNPAAVISDAFYCINVYDDPVRFRNDILTLFIMCAVILAVSFVVVRRERYDSI